MKKAISIVTVVLAGLLAPVAAAGERAEKSVNVVLAGDAAANTISIGVSTDGRSYVIESGAPLEVGGAICSHAEGMENELLCEAAPIAGFEINGNGGDDTLVLAPTVPVPATLRGGPGDDKIYGGAAADKLIGGPGNDTLAGRSGDDSLFGGPGEDRLYGGPGDDTLRGGDGVDLLSGGSGTNQLIQ